MKRPQLTVAARFRAAYVLLAAVVCAAGILAFTAWKNGRTVPAPARAAHAQVAKSQPTVVSPACDEDSLRELACNEVLTYLRATDLDDTHTACAQLSSRSPLRHDCQARMRDGKGKRIQYGILDARPSSSGIAVFVELGPPRSRFVILLVPEGGSLRVLDIEPA